MAALGREKVLVRFEEGFGFYRERNGDGVRRCCLIAAGMHRAAQCQAFIDVFGLDCVVEGGVDLFSSELRSAAALDEAVERVDNQEVCCNGARLYVEGGNVITGATGADDFRRVVGVDMIRQDDDCGVGFSSCVQSR